MMLEVEEALVLAWKALKRKRNRRVSL